MYAAHRLRTSSRSYIDLPGDDLWSAQFFVEPDVVEDAPAADDVSSAVRSASGSKITEPSVVLLHDGRERIKVRFRLLRRLPPNHDAEGASAPCPLSVDRAIAFIDK